MRCLGIDLPAPDDQGHGRLHTAASRSNPFVSARYLLTQVPLDLLEASRCSSVPMSDLTDVTIASRLPETYALVWNLEPTSRPDWPVWYPADSPWFIHVRRRGCRVRPTDYETALGVANTENKELRSAECGDSRQNPQTKRKRGSSSTLDVRSSEEPDS